MSFQNIIVVIIILIFALLSLAKGIRTLRSTGSRSTSLKWYKNVNILLFLVLGDIACVLAISPMSKVGSVLFFLMLFLALIGFILALTTTFLVLPTWWSELMKGNKSESRK